MKIFSMTATFGKLENQTLTLQPGLNIIHAPNEWGKSTWCAFLAIMLYGLDTREKTTKTTLAAKERYAPWSGSPMSGRMDLHWNGKDITIERWTKGRTPMGEFRAYETASGMAVPELTAATCGETLLGVERSVFLRAGYLRLSDLPLTQDESLRRRLNALVTTGDESNAGDLLAQKLRDLKNKCRYNRSGLIPQAEAERNDLEGKLMELQTLQTQSAKIKERQQELELQVAALENHQQALDYEASQGERHRVEAAHLAAEAAAEKMAKLADICVGLPSRATAMDQLQRHSMLQQELTTALQEAQALPPEPSKPQIPERYRGVSPQDAIAIAETDVRKYTTLDASIKKNNTLWGIYAAAAVLALILAIVVGNAGLWIAISIALILGGGAIAGTSYIRTSRIRNELQVIYDRYPGISPNRWVEDAEFYAETQWQYAETLHNTSVLHQKSKDRIQALQAELTALTEGADAESWILSRNRMISNHDALTDAHREHQHAAAYADSLRSTIKTVRKPTQPDALTYTAEETARLLADAHQEQRQLQLRSGQCQGRMEALGQQAQLQSQLDAVKARLVKLNATYNALELALHTLADATAELQRRFAPRIAQASQELFGKLTGGRYNRLSLSQDLSVNAGAADESILRAAQWRSEGTMDQLYLAVRLAVARELTPNAPLILDDALVRFDDTRHAAAMEILREEAQQKQVILFTCQSRELDP